MFTNMDIVRVSHPRIGNMIDTVLSVEQKPQTTILSAEFQEEARNRLHSYMQDLLKEQRFQNVAKKQIEENPEIAESKKIEAVINEYAEFCFQRALENESIDWHRSQTTEFRLNEVEGCFRNLYSDPNELALAVHKQVTTALNSIYREHKKTVSLEF